MFFFRLLILIVHNQRLKKFFFQGNRMGDNSLVPDQARRFVGSDVDPNCLQKS